MTLGHIRDVLITVSICKPMVPLCVAVSLYGRSLWSATSLQNHTHTLRGQSSKHYIDKTTSFDERKRPCDENRDFILQHEICVDSVSLCISLCVSQAYILSSQYSILSIVGRPTTIVPFFLSSLQPASAAAQTIVVLNSCRGSGPLFAKNPSSSSSSDKLF